MGAFPGAFAVCAVCLAGAGAFAVCGFCAGAFIAVGALPFGGGFPFGAAIAVPQRAPHTASAITIFCIALFIVVFLSSSAQAHSRAYKKTGRSTGSF